MDTLHVVVKCPVSGDTSAAEWAVDAPAAWTVGELKAALRRGHPCGPEEEDLRLVICGRIPDDAEELLDLATADVLVVHMVLRSGRYDAKPRHCDAAPVSAALSPPSVTHSPVSTAASDSLPSVAFNFAPQVAPFAIGGADADSPCHPGLFSPSAAVPCAETPVFAPCILETADAAGRVHAVDVSNALLFDGRSFYVVRGGAAFHRQSAAVSREVLHAHAAAEARIERRNVANGRAVDNQPEANGARRDDRPEGADAPAEAPRGFAIDIGLVVRVAFMAVVVLQALLATSSGEPLRLALLAMALSAIFLGHLGILPLREAWDEGAAAVDAAWRALIERHARPGGAESASLLVRVARLPLSAAVHVGEIAATFVLSIFTSADA